MQCYIKGNCRAHVYNYIIGDGFLTIYCLRVIKQKRGVFKLVKTKQI